MPELYSQYAFQNIGIEQMKAHYLFDASDAQRLQMLEPIAQESLAQMQQAFYSFIFNFEHARIFLGKEEILEKHRQRITQWYLQLFSGNYDDAYFHRLAQISETHVKIGLPSHYVNAAFSFIRQFLEKTLIETNNTDALPSMHKIVDINLDILSLTYKQESQEKLINNIMILKKTIANRSLIPYVQPIFSNTNGKIVHYECLMRTEDKENGTVCSILPMLQLAKQLILYTDLMHIMIEKVFDAFYTLPYSFTLNIGFDDVKNPSSRAFIIEHLKKLPNPSRVVFEILESDMVEDFVQLSDFVSQLRSFGCKIAIDDFGAGYSNMENILKLSPDCIKIDGSLIHNIDQSEESLKMVENIINIAHDINAKTVAEHVHSQTVYRTLNAMEIDYLQGYYLAKPFPLTELSVNSISVPEK